MTGPFEAVNRARRDRLYRVRPQRCEAGSSPMSNGRIDDAVEPFCERGVGDGVAGRISDRRNRVQTRMGAGVHLRSTNSPAMLAKSSA